jgi:AcrR family transcriptional regulator
MSRNAKHVSAEAADRPDRRVRRTRHALQHAMVELVLEKGYERVSVADVTDRADVGRSTFYAHYRDKEDLFLSGIEDEIRSAFEDAPADASSSTEWLFRHAGQHVDLYRALVRRRGGWELVRRRMEDTLTDVVAERLRAGGRADASVDVAARYVASALLGVLTWWLASGATNQPEELDATFRALANDGLEQHLGVRL